MMVETTDIFVALSLGALFQFVFLIPLGFFRKDFQNSIIFPVVIVVALYAGTIFACIVPALEIFLKLF